MPMIPMAPPKPAGSTSTTERLESVAPRASSHPLGGVAGSAPRHPGVGGNSALPQTVEQRMTRDPRGTRHSARAVPDQWPGYPKDLARRCTRTAPFTFTRWAGHCPIAVPTIATRLFSMKIAVFSSKAYDRHSLELHNARFGHERTFGSVSDVDTDLLSCFIINVL
jgi:hypothetical protein